jgi:hypothetical protein
MLMIHPNQALPKDGSEILIEQLTIEGIILQQLINSSCGYPRDD